MDSLTQRVMFNMKSLLYHDSIFVILSQDPSLCLCDFRRKKKDAERASQLSSRSQRR